MVSSLLRIQHPQYYLHLEHTGESFDERVCFEVRLDVVLLLRPRSQHRASRMEGDSAHLGQRLELCPLEFAQLIHACWYHCEESTSMLSDDEMMRPARCLPSLCGGRVAAGLMREVYAARE